MGIRGLTSFIDSNQRLLLKDHRLQKCRVVIDGNLFFHDIFFKLQGRCQFGGDYDVYEREISRIFSIFKACSVEAFVVFDGAYTVDGKKSDTTIRRAKEKLWDAKCMIEGESKTVIPCLARETFRQTLNKLGIPHVTCDFEADNQLVTLANRWQCPVISNDSDFYVFQMQGGFIPLKYIDFSSCDDSATFLTVKYYHVDHLSRLYPRLSVSVLPVLASVQGNDFIDSEVLKPFIWAVIRKYGTPGEHQRIVPMFCWLQEKDNPEGLVLDILRFLPQTIRRTVAKQLADSIGHYKNQYAFESFDLGRVLEGDSDRLAAYRNTMVVTTSNGESLPDWFVAACRMGEMPASLLNVALSHGVILPVQGEGDCAGVTASTTSKPIRQVAYGVLLAHQRQAEAEVVEHTKGELDLMDMKVQPRTSLSSVGAIPALAQVPDLGQEVKLAILLETLGVSAEYIRSFDIQLQLYMACLAFWAKQAEPSVTRHHLRAILLCAVLLYVHREVDDRHDRNPGAAVASQPARGSRQLSIRSTCSAVDTILLRRVKQNLGQFYQNPIQINSTNSPDHKTFSLSAQFQACVVDVIQLNSLLQCPLPNPQPATLFNGSFIYTTVHHLQLSSDPKLLLHEMLAEGSALAVLFDALFSAVEPFMRSNRWHLILNSSLHETYF